MKSSIGFIKQYVKHLMKGIPFLIVVFAITVVLFSYIMHEVILEREEATDHRIFNFLAANVIQPGLTPVMKSITWFASSLFLQIAYAVVCIIYLLVKDWKRAIEIGIIGLGGFGVNYFMKLWFERPRPADPLMDPLQNFSFPSGHAMSGFIFYGLLAYLVWKSELSINIRRILIPLLILFALLIGFSRIYLRMHYPTDVAAGFCIGAAWLVGCIWLMEKLKKKTAASH